MGIDELERDVDECIEEARINHSTVIQDCHDRLQKIFMVEKTSVGCKVRCKYPPCLTVALKKLSQQPDFTRAPMARAYFHLNMLNDPDWENDSGECRGQDARAYLLLGIQFDL